MGRPETTMDDLPANWKEDIITLASEGASDVEIRAKLGITKDFWYKFKKRGGEFTETLKKAKLLCKAWWLEKGRKNLDNKEFSPVLWYMNMKNRFGWSDKKVIKQDIDIKGKVRLTDEEKEAIRAITKESECPESESGK